MDKSKNNLISYDDLVNKTRLFMEKTIKKLQFSKFMKKTIKRHAIRRKSITTENPND